MSDAKKVPIYKLGKIVDSWKLSMIVSKAEDYLNLEYKNKRNKPSIYEWTMTELGSYVYDRYCDELETMSMRTLHYYVIPVALDQGLIDLDDLEGLEFYD